MKSTTSPVRFFWHRLVLLLLAGCLAGTAAIPETSVKRKLDMELSKNGSSLKVAVPKGALTVTLQRFQREGGWKRVAEREAKPGTMRFKLPASARPEKWRVIGRFASEAGRRSKFPAAFYQGENDFKPRKSGAKGIEKLLRCHETGIDSGFDTDSPVEADIWKVDGNTVYFFNQLRGLQVLDLTNPSDPRMTASLKLPVVGQDLYLLPGTGAERHLVLLTVEFSIQSGERTFINLVKVSGGKVEITHTQKLGGYLADSRMVGNRLILATTETDWSAKEPDEWTSSTSLSEWLVSPDAAPVAAGKTVIEGHSPLIAAGPGWLALAVYPTAEWSVSDVSVFAVRPAGLVRMAPVFRTAGVVGSQFGIQWKDNVLTTISEKSTRKNDWLPVTVLESFRAWSPEVIHTQVFEGRLGRLELAYGESLFATRFAGNKAYVVTFLQTDPLFVVDLADPANPRVAGELKVPGWSTHLEPLGDLLFAIGWEDNAPIASLFDVADPASPQLLRRLKLGDEGTYSEALWDEKALKFLPDAGLAMVPLSTYQGESGNSTQVVQLVDVDTNARDLRLRGAISHDFDARRAALIGDVAVSISQRVMVAADVADRDAPSVLSEVSLAWPVDRVLELGKHLIQIEDGSAYGGNRPTARISPVDATEQILAEFDLGRGTVKAADLRDGKLLILRESEPAEGFFLRRASIVADPKSRNRLVLEIYDATSLPELFLLGSSAIRPAEGGYVAVDRFLWPQENRPAVVADFSSSVWYDRAIFRSAGGTTLAEAAAPSRARSKVRTDVAPDWLPDRLPFLIVFDTSDAANPTVGSPLVLSPKGTVLNGVAEAADGLVVIGSSQWRDVEKGKWFGTGVALQSVRVAEVPSAGEPVARPVIDLPGALFAVTELDREGFLAWTRSARGKDTDSLQVSVSDGFDAFAITALDVSSQAAVTAGGRRLFVATNDGVEVHRLSGSGELSDVMTLDTGWRADSLRWQDGTLAGSRSNGLFVADDKDGVVTRWKISTWNTGVGRIVLTKGGDVLVPFGEYGAERLKR